MDHRSCSESIVLEWQYRNLDLTWLYFVFGPYPTDTSSCFVTICWGLTDTTNTIITGGWIMIISHIIYTVLTNSNERFITLFLDILTIYMNTSCLSPAESGLHWYWASAARVQRRSDNVSTGSLTMMTRRITDDGLTLWYEEVAGSGVWCGLSCTDDHCRAALQSGSYSQAGCQTGLDFPKFCSSNHPPPPNRCPEYGVQLPLSHARGFLRIFSELTTNWQLSWHCILLWHSTELSDSLHHFLTACLLAFQTA